MKALITGANGLIGSSLKEELLKKGWDVYCHSRSLNEKDQRVKWIQFDLSDPNLKNIQFPEIEIVFHLAGQTSSYKARQDPLYDMQINLEGFLNLLLALKKNNRPPVVIFAGTSTQSGLSEDFPITEKTKDDPVSFYDISKLSAEMYLKQFVNEGWIKGCCLRLANVYGGFTNQQLKDRGIIDKVYQRALDGELIFVYGEGNFLRDYIHINDVVSAFISASDNIEFTNGKNFIIASGISYTLKEAFQIAIDIATENTGRQINISSIEIPSNMSPIDLRNVKYNIEEFRRLTGWSPKFDLPSGLRYSYKDKKNK